MGISKGVGVILVICSKCGTILYNYSIGDKGNKAKFGGVPTPSRALSGYDGYVCPVCNQPLNIRPRKVQVMHWRKFLNLYEIMEGPPPRLKPRTNMVEKQIRSTHDLSRGLGITSIGGEVSAEAHLE